jgi:hypothetical protein
MLRNAALAVLACVTVSLLCAAPALAYNRDNAVSWADANWHNTDHHDFPGWTNPDCTTYASGAMRQGGLNYDWSNWWARYTNGIWAWSTAFVNAQELRLYFWGKSSGVSEVGSGYNWYQKWGFAQPEDDTAMIRGDVVSINFDRNDNQVSDHTEFGVGRGQSELQNGGTGLTFYGDMIDQRTTDRHHAIWHMWDRVPMGDMVNYVFRVWHLSDSFVN